MAGEISVNQASAVLRQAMRDTIRKRSTLYLVQGALLVFAGVIALLSPMLASAAIIAFLGWLLIFAGIASAIGLIGATQVPFFWLQLVSAVLAVVVGWIFVTRPEAGLAAVVLLMVVYFFVEGISRIVFALMIRPMEDWIWLLASGILGIVLGVILAANAATAGAWLIGFLLGLKLIGIGGAQAFLAWNLRRAVTA
jgi:uncharacterized membrane protein HdeD (DUF308 family)